MSTNISGTILRFLSAFDALIYIHHSFTTGGTSTFPGDDQSAFGVNLLAGGQMALVRLNCFSERCWSSRLMGSQSAVNQ